MFAKTDGRLQLGLNTRRDARQDLSPNNEILANVMYVLRRAIGDVWRNTWIWIGNGIRGLGRRLPYFVHLRLDGSLPEQTLAEPRWYRFASLVGIRFRPPGVSLSGLRRVFERLGTDPHAQGVVIQLDGLRVNWSKAQSLRKVIQSLRDDGKQVIVLASDYDNLKYYIACAADTIIASPSAGWNVIGLQINALYLKDALSAVDVRADVVAVSPYKTAGDILTRADMSPEERENLEDIVQIYFDELVSAIAHARDLSEELVHDLIDRAPLRIDEARSEGLVDHVCYLDEIESLVLQSENRQKRVRLLTLPAVARRLKRPLRWRSGKSIGVVALEGTIVAGTNRRSPIPLPLPFVNPQQAGADSVSAALRMAEKDRSIAAVVLYINSPGGSSLASDAIWREVSRLARKKPVVAFMDGIATSGGYYVSTHANWIVSQQLTQTGSIGVVWMKLIVSDLIDKLRIGRVSITRGENAGIFSDIDPLDPEQKAQIEQYVFSLYDQFKQRVSDGRDLSNEELDRVSGGRVWIGSQALAHRLVDQIGDFECAVDKARELAGLAADRWSPVVWITPHSLSLLPEATSLDPEGLGRWLEHFLSEYAWYISPTHLKID